MKISTSRLALLLLMFVTMVGCVGDAPPDDPTDPSSDGDSATEPAPDPGMPSDPGETSTSFSTCAGKVYGGACWYAAANGQSCAAFCGAHGGYDSKTATLAGTSDSFCNHTLDLLRLNPSAPFYESNCTALMGCFASALDGTAGVQSRCLEGSSPTAFSLASYYTTRRACACNK